MLFLAHDIHKCLVQKYYKLGMSTGINYVHKLLAKIEVECGTEVVQSLLVGGIDILRAFYEQLPCAKKVQT